MDIDALRQDLIVNAELLGHPFTLHTTWGLFSPRGIDEGSALLLEHLQVAPDTRALDIGCGYGPLGLAIAAAAPQGRADLVDRDYVAIEYARANAARNRLDNVEVYPSNALSAVPPGRTYDLVVSNLPAKVGNELFRLMFHDAHAHMAPEARIVVVTINGLRDFIKRQFTQTFGNYEKLKQGRSYTVSAAVRQHA